MTAEIRVNLYGGLERYSPEGLRRDNRVPGDQVNTVAEVLDYFDIPREEARIILIDGHHAGLQDRVKPGKVISIFPLVGGG